MPRFRMEALSAIPHTSYITRTSLKRLKAATHIRNTLNRPQTAHKRTKSETAMAGRVRKHTMNPKLMTIGR
eukprot:4347779-Amphidinium_carterae.1